MPDVRPNGFAFELPVEKPERNGNRGEAHQRPDKIKNALHRSPEDMDGHAATRAAAVPGRHRCTMCAPIARGNLEEPARGTIADAFASHENKQENSGFNARAEPDL